MADDDECTDHVHYYNPISTMKPMRVRLDWMDPGDFITGLSRGESWNGFEVVWLDWPAIYALDRASVDAGNDGLFEPEEAPLAVAPSLDGDGLVLLDVQPDGARTEMWFMTDETGERWWNFEGWTFEALPPTPST